MFHVPNFLRVRTGQLKTTEAAGNNGAFTVAAKKPGVILHVIASDGEGWEHVSVHAEENSKKRVPTWAEMCQIKDMFWDDSDVVMQLHPARSEYVNNHRHVLHLWRPIGAEIPLPPIHLVGFVGVDHQTAQRVAEGLAPLLGD